MTDQMYQKLNLYLNGIFKSLEENDSFLIENILPISIMSEKIFSFMKDYDLNRNKIHANLNYQEVYLSARQIIETIDKNYLKYYDHLIESGELDFDYENKYRESICMHFFNTGQNLINMRMDFNYLDVPVLVHEFMHYTNSLTKEYTVNRYILTEAISIYFETYAKQYLFDQGIDENELWFNERLYYIRENIKKFQNYDLILLAYSKFGNIDENTYEMLTEFFYKISKPDFEKMCENLLKVLEKRSKEIEFETKMKLGCIPNNYEGILFRKLVKLVNVDYRYIFGTIVAYYALQYSSVEKMAYLNNHINDKKNSNLNDVLKLADIDLENLSLDSIKCFLDEEGKTK